MSAAWTNGRTGARGRIADIPPPAVLFAALGDPTRLALVTRLSDDGPASIARLTQGSTVTRQAVTKHPGILQRAGIVTATRTGRETECRLSNDGCMKRGVSLTILPRSGTWRSRACVHLLRIEFACYPTLRSRPAQNGARSSRFSTLPGPDFGKASARRSTPFGTL